MQKNWFAQGKALLYAERQRAYQGMLKVKLEQIIPDPPGYRDLDKKFLKLKQTLQKGRYKRLDAKNHIPAIVTRPLK